MVSLKTTSITAILKILAIMNDMCYTIISCYFRHTKKHYAMVLPYIIGGYYGSY